MSPLGGRARQARMLLVPLSLIASNSLPACSDDSERHHEITDVRVVENRGQALGASSAERFGLIDRRAPTQPQDLFAYEVPEGWEQLPPAQFRDLNFRVGRVGGAEGADCYVTLLSGGGEDANINRWRGQMGLAPLDDAGLRALPRRTFLGLEGILAEFQGSFQGMGDTGNENAEDSTLLGVFSQFPRFAVSVKMIGPTPLVEAERENFLSFCDSLQFKTVGTASDAPGSTGVDGGAGGSGAGAFAWDVPDGWVLGAGSSMRLVTFNVEDRPSAECWVTVLKGDAGGLLPNLNRWRGELGQEPLTGAEVEALPTIEVFGKPAPFLQVQGPVAEDGRVSYLFGVITERAGQRVFIKMVGGKQDLLAEEHRFIQFCRSLRD